MARQYGFQLSQPYKQALKAGLFEYLQKMPWAMTVMEIAREEEGGFLKRLYADIKKDYPKYEKKALLRDTSRVLREQIIRPMISKQQIIGDSLSRLGYIYFKIGLGLTRAGTGKRRSYVISRKDEAEKRFAVRILLEYWDLVLERKIEKASQYFKILYYLGDSEKGKLNTNELADLVVIERVKIVRAIIMQYSLDKTHKTRPALIQLIKRGSGRKSNVYALSPFFQEVWDIAMDEHTLKQWNDWKRFRTIQAKWSRSRG